MNNKILILILTFFTAAISAQQKGIKQLQTANLKLQTSSYAVVIGISDYQDPGIPDLRFADKDAEAFANYLRSAAGGLLDADHLKVLVNSQATMAQFANALDWLWEVSKEGDQVIIYFSGHGDVEKKSLTQPGFLLCWDAPARVYMAGGAFALPMLQEVVSTLSIQNKAKVIVITDACRSGTLAGSSVGGSQATAANLAKQFANEIKIMSCQPNEYSIEGEQWGGGRGAFSFHLIDALYGLADANDDQWVSLQEVSRYLEDHVSNEVAPISQVPMVIGNRTERLTNVNPGLLASIRSGKTNQMAMLTSIESRGIEDIVLSGVDTTIKELYQLFKKSLKDKIFLEPKNKCADAYYERLVLEPKLERLYSTMRRNYAAALQDDAQNILNTLLRKGIEKALTTADQSGETYLQFPKLLERAAELLGKDHYFYNSLLARKYFFESYLVKSNEAKMEKCRQSLSLLNDFPLAYWRMANLQAWNFGRNDSAQYYCKKAIESAPGWARPYCDMGLYSDGANVDSIAEISFHKAYDLDSTSAVLWYTKGLFYSYSYTNRISQTEKAILSYEKALTAANSDGLCFPCIYINLASLYQTKGDTMKALSLYKAGLKTDSLNAIILSNLGSTYKKIRQYDSAILYVKKAIKSNPKLMTARANLTHTYFLQKNYQEGESACLQALKIDPDEPDILENYADILLATGRKELAIINYRKSHIGFIKKYSLERAKDIMVKLFNVDSMSNETKLLKLDFENKFKNRNENISYGFLMLNYDSTISKYWNYIGDGYREISDYANAIYYYNRSLSIDSTQRTIKISRAFCYDELHQSEKAIEDLRQVLAIDSSQCTALNNLGRIYLNLGSYENAERLLNQSMRCDPKFAYPYKHLAMIKYKRGQFEEAKQYLLKAIELDPDYIKAYIGMAYVFSSENNPKQAIHYVELAIQKKATFDQLEKDNDLADLRKFSEWEDLMKKYFPDKMSERSGDPAKREKN